MHLLLARAAFMAIGFGVGVILGRGLGPANYGIYGVLISVLVWLELVGHLGLPSAAGILLHDRRFETRAVEQASKVLLLGVAAVLFVLVWSSAPRLAAWLNIEDGARLLRIAILDLPLAGLYTAYQGQLNGHRQFGTLSIALVVYALTKLIAVLILWAYGLSVAGALIVNVVPTAGVLVFLFTVRPPRGPWPTRALASRMLRLALPIGLFLTTFTALSNMDLWLLKALRGSAAEDELVGIYAASFGLSRMLSIVPAVMAGVLFASLAMALARADEAMALRHVRASGRFAFVVLAPSCAILGLFAEEIMLFVYGPDYAGGGKFLTLQVLAVATTAFFDLFCQASLASGKQVRTALILLALVPVSIGLDVVWIRAYGGVGAASALLATALLGAGISGTLTYRRFGGLLPLPMVARVLVATGLTAAVAWFVPLSGWVLVPGLPALLGVYAVLLFLVRELTDEDLKSVAFWRR